MDLNSLKAGNSLRWGGWLAPCGWLAVEVYVKRDYVKEIVALWLWLTVAGTSSTLLGLIIVQWEMYNGFVRVQCEWASCWNDFLQPSACQKLRLVHRSAASILFGREPCQPLCCWQEQQMGFCCLSSCCRSALFWAGRGSCVIWRRATMAACLLQSVLGLWMDHITGRVREVLTLRITAPETWSGLLIWDPESYMFFNASL